MSLEDTIDAIVTACEGMTLKEERWHPVPSPTLGFSALLIGELIEAYPNTAYSTVVQGGQVKVTRTR